MIQNFRPQLQRDGDLFIMDGIQKYENEEHSSSQMNKCRIYVQALTLSNIVTPDDKYISIKDQWEDGEIRLSRTRITAPTKKIAYKYWKEWREMLVT